jgi:hypothetical protein
MKERLFADTAKQRVFTKSLIKEILNVTKMSVHSATSATIATSTHVTNGSLSNSCELCTVRERY